MESRGMEQGRGLSNILVFLPIAFSAFLQLIKKRANSFHDHLF